MDLLLVRCADLGADAKGTALNGLESDRDERDAMAAALSARGERHARRLAAWVGAHAPQKLQVFSSPAKGARQMAGMIVEGLGEAALPPIVSRLLVPTSNASDILGAVGWPHDHRAALVIAHQPALGGLASLLLSGQEASLAFKRGAIWWFSNRHRGGEQQTVLRCALTPDLLKGNTRSVRQETAQAPKPMNLDLSGMVEHLRSRLMFAVR